MTHPLGDGTGPVGPEATPPAPRSPSLVTIHDLRVALGGVSILEGIHMDLARGRISALIGLNGSGKTTLLRALVKEVPSTGQIRFHCGHDHTGATPEYVGYVPQRLTIESSLPLTVLDLFALSLQKRPLWMGVRHAVRAQAEGLLERVGVRGLLDRQVDKLSGGQLQRVLLALALQPKPELLLLDEPAAGIDFQDQQMFYRVIGDLNQDTGVTVLLVSHDLSIVSQMAHHVYCLKDGRVFCHGTPQQILTGETLAETFGPEMAIYTHTHHHAH